MDGSHMTGQLRTDRRALFDRSREASELWLVYRASYSVATVLHVKSLAKILLILTTTIISFHNNRVCGA